jgi:Cu/Ag efflux protein CusF
MRLPKRTASLVLICLPLAFTGLSLVITTNTAQAQQKKAAKSYVFKGKVQSVGEKGLTVANEKVDGWMDAMTMMYSVDKPEVLKKVKAGDQIQATVFDGDYTLHDVQVVPPAKK